MREKNQSGTVKLREPKKKEGQCKICSTPDATHTFKGGHICSDCLTYIRSKF
jgi:hypothetical protein